jgi:hypothetical protein
VVLPASTSTDRFQTYNRNLDGIDEGKEKFSDHTKVQMFLKQIRDPHYKTTIAVIKNHTGNGDIKLIQAIAKIRKCELELIQDRKGKRRYESPRRQKKKKAVSDSDSEDPNEVAPSPTKRRKQEKLRRLPPNVQLTSGGRISIPKEDWDKSTPEDKTFIQDWNSRVKNKEETDELVVPPGTKLSPSTEESKQRTRRKTPEGQQTHPLSTSG